MSLKLKKRERRKKCRKKNDLINCSRTTSFKSFKTPWSMPLGYQLSHLKISYFWKKEQIDHLFKSTADKISEELVSQQCYNAVEGHTARSFIDNFGIVLKKRFKLFRIKKAINDHIPRHSGLSVPHLIENHITFGQLHAFLRYSFVFNFTPELLGNFWPVFLKRLTQCFLDMKPKEPVITSDTFLVDFKMSEITWLRKLPSALQFVIIQNVFLYLCTLAINIVGKAFYLARTSCGQSTIYRRGVWNQIEDYGFKMLIAQRRLKLHPLSPSEFENTPGKAPVHRLTFIPKTRNVRPIVTFKNTNFSTNLMEIKAILDLIIKENSSIFGFGLKSLSTFPFKYKKFILANRKVVGENFWMTGDLMNCFTCIDHDILEKCLARYIDKNREFTVVNYFMRVNNIDDTQRTFRAFVAGKNLADAKNNFHTRYNITMASNPCFVNITGAQLLNRIKFLVLMTPIKYGKNLFICQRGISQGNVISVKLCNIYLGAMEQRIFSNNIPKEISCWRYVDDYLIVSKDKNLVVKVVEKLNAGAKNFGIQLNTSKTTISFISTDEKMKSLKLLEKKRRLAWCGFAFNTKNLSMSLDYCRYKKRTPKSTITNFPGNVSAKLGWIQKTLKKVLMTRMNAIRVCSSPYRYKRRRLIRRRFAGFVMDFYVRYFARMLRLNISKRFAHSYLRKVLKWTTKGFRKKFEPTI